MSISSSPTPAALRIEIRPSNYFCAMLFGVALAASIAILYADMAWPLRLLLGVVTLIYCGYCWRAQRGQRGILQWHSAWLWRGADNIERVLRLRYSTQWPGLIVLTFSEINSRASGRAQTFTLTLLADSFACGRGEDARRLRMHLAHFPVFSVDTHTE